MVKNIVLILILTISSITFHGIAKAKTVKPPVFSTYHGEQITAESLPLFTAKIPKQDLIKIKAWLLNPLHQRTIQGLVTLKWPLAGSTGNFGEQLKGINQLLEIQNMHNLSRWNYIFEIPNAGYVIAIAGILNRVHNLLVYNDPNPNNPQLQDTTPDNLCDSVITKQPATYQTVSRMAHYLRALEAIEKYNLTAFSLPKTYLLGIDGNKPKTANDKNCVIIQEKMGENVIPMRQVPEKQRTMITPDELRQLYMLTIYAGLWELRGNLLLDQKSGKFVITDWEQPNNSNPADFFHTREAKVIHNIRVGMAQIYELFAGVPTLKAICDEFANLKDEELIAIGSFNG